MKILFGLISFAVIFGGGWFVSDISLFWDIPSFVAVVFPLFFWLMSKYGVLILRFWKLDKEIQNDIVIDGGYLSIIWGFAVSLIGLSQMFLSLSDPSALGPALAFGLVSTLYGFLFFLFVFYPLQKSRSNSDLLIIHDNPMYMRLLGALLSVILLFTMIYAGGSFKQFLSLPSFMISIVPIPFLILFKHGVKGLLFFKQKPEYKQQVVDDGYLIVALLAGISIVSQLMAVYVSLPQTGTIGRDLVPSLIGPIYSIVFALLVFFPQSRKPIPKYVIAIPMLGTIMVVLGLFSLISAYCKS